MKNVVYQAFVAKKRFFVLLLALIASVLVSYADVYSGSCGTDLTWSFNTEDSTLTITGSGDMENYVYRGTPWYEYQSAIKIVSLPNGITSIGNYAFGYCKNLASINIPNSVTIIGNSAFQSCSSLQSATIPSSVNTIGNWGFSGCGMVSINIPNSVTNIGTLAFSGLLNVAYNGTASGSPWGASCLNGSVDGFLVYSDQEHTNLVRCSKKATGAIVVPNTVTSMGNAFYECRQITSLTLPGSITSIGREAIRFCENLTSVTLGEGLKTISDGAFSDCVSLTSIVLPKSVISVGKYVFARCTSLTSIDVVAGGAYCSEDGVLFNKSKTTLVSYPGGKQGDYVIPSSVNSITDHAFSGCAGITAVIIPDGISRIGSCVFSQCSNLTSVTIGTGVTYIDTQAFQHCIPVNINLI